jgi:hypothetical protein
VADLEAAVAAAHEDKAAADTLASELETTR